MLFFLTHACFSGDSIQSEAEWLLSVGSAGAYSCLPTYEDAQENSGTPVICVLRHLRPHWSPHLHSKTSGFIFVCVTDWIVYVLLTCKNILDLFNFFPWNWRYDKYLRLLVKCFNFILFCFVCLVLVSVVFLYSLALH